MNKKANEQFRMNEREIIQVFMTLLEKEDIQKITVNKICQYAHINRSTFYNHFSDIYAVLEKMWDIHLQNISVIFESNGVQKNRKDNLRLILNYMKQNALFYRVSFHSSLNEKVYDGLNLILKSHEVKKMDLKNAYKLHFFEQGMISTISYWLDHNCDLDVEEVINVIDESYPKAD